MNPAAPTRALVALSLVGVLLGALVGWLWWADQRGAQTATARREALHSAREQVAAELSDPATTRVDVLAAGVVRAEPDRAVVLLFVNLATQQSPSGPVRLSAHRIELSMTRTGGRWRVAGLERV